MTKTNKLYLLFFLFSACTNNSYGEDFSETKSRYLDDNKDQTSKPMKAEKSKDVGKPLASVGRWLNDHGIQPRLTFGYISLWNPSQGLNTGEDQAVQLYFVGADFDMERLVGLPGGNIHFEQLYVPEMHNLEYGSDVGDINVGHPAPFIPKVSHLRTFTYEQKLFNGQLAMELGKDQAFNHFAIPLCNNPLRCVNYILQNSAGFNPPPYSNWSARIAYKFKPELQAQLAVWRSNDAFPFTNGWEWSGKDIGEVTTVYLGNLTYQTSFQSDTYPEKFEILGFYHNKKQNDPYYTINGTSQVFDSNAEADSTKGISGIYLGGKKTFWRLDGGEGNSISPTSLSAFGSYTHSFNHKAAAGVLTQINSGLILTGPFQSRPFDSYSINMTWTQLTKRKQWQLEDAHSLVTGGDHYRPGRNEFSVGLDANFVLFDNIVLSPFVVRSFNSSTAMNPYAGENPRDGYAAGLLIHVGIDEMLGLRNRPPH